MKVHSATNLFDNCDIKCRQFNNYYDTLENALNIIDKCDLEKFKKECSSNEFHWSNYTNFVHTNYLTTKP